MLVMGQVEFMLQNAAHPQIGGGVITADADFFADQVRRLGYAFGGVDEDEAVAKAAMEKHRDGDERQAVIFGDHVVRHREFGDVELPVAQHARMAHLRGHIGQYRELDAVRLNDAFFQCANALVIAGGECQM